MTVPVSRPAMLACQAAWTDWYRHDGYRHTALNMTPQRAEATTTPEGAKGWVDPAGSAQVRTGGHGLDVAPDASPDGIRAEARRAEDGNGGEPSNAPNAAAPFTPDSHTTGPVVPVFQERDGRARGGEA